jgi:hypothetical protein
MRTFSFLYLCDYLFHLLYYCRGSVSIILLHVIHFPHPNFDLFFVLIWFLLYLSLSSCFHFLFYMWNTSPMTLFVHVIHLPHVVASLGSPACFCFCLIVFVFVSFFVIRYIPFVLVFSLFLVHVRHLPHQILSLSCSLTRPETSSHGMSL